MGCQEKVFYIGKNLLNHFDRVKEVFLFDVTTEVVMKDIPKNLIINWDQTSLT